MSKLCKIRFFLKVGSGSGSTPPGSTAANTTILFKEQEYRKIVLKRKPTSALANVVLVIFVQGKLKCRSNKFRSYWATSHDVISQKNDEKTSI